MPSFSKLSDFGVKNTAPAAVIIMNDLLLLIYLKNYIKV